jgi:hypothetical protein
MMGPDDDVNRRRRPDAGRAVSNTVAFVLVFSLIVTSVGIVATVGFDSIEDVRNAQQAETSTGVVRAVGGGIDEITRGERPSYSDSLELGGGGIAVVNETTVDVDVSGTSFDETYHPRAIRYAHEERNTSYVSGVLARGSERQPAVLVSGPATTHCSPAAGVATVTVVKLTPVGGGAVGGGPVSIEVERNRSAPPANTTRLEYPTDRPHPSASGVSVTVDGPWRNAWREALVERGFSAAGGGTFTCPATRVTVRQVRIEVELIA